MEGLSKIAKFFCLISKDFLNSVMMVFEWRLSTLLQVSLLLVCLLGLFGQILKIHGIAYNITLSNGNWDLGV